MKMIFEIAEQGQAPIPLLQFDVRGRRRVPDGKTMFDLAGATKASGLTQKYLTDLWEGTWGEYVEEIDEDEPAGTYLIGVFGGGAISNASIGRCSFSL